MSREIDEIVNDVISSRIAGIHTSLPGRIESFDGSLASVKPLIKKVFTDDEELSLPVIPGVPVIFPSTADFQFTFPLAKGDDCLLIFAERDLANWIAKGTDSAPADTKKYDLSDAIAIPGLYSPAVDPKTYDDTNIIISFKGATFKIQPDGKFAVGNSNAELIEVLSDFMDLVLTSNCVNGAPLTRSTSGEMLALKTKLDTFLKGAL
jgi:hypothetical protein